MVKLYLLVRFRPANYLKSNSGTPVALLKSGNGQNNAKSN